MTVMKTTRLFLLFFVCLNFGLCFGQEVKLLENSVVSDCTDD
jgi:hypothetical protein